MADYIKTNILFESYVHIDAVFESESEAVDNIKKHINDYIHNRSAHFLYPEIETEVKFKEGSIKAYATVKGSLLKALGVYDNFSQAINKLFWFSKRLSDASVMEVAFQTGSFLGAIERTEARPGIVGQTKRITDTLLSIRTVDDDKSVKHLLKNFRFVRKDIVNLFQSIEDKEDKLLLKKEFEGLFDLTPRRLSHMRITEESKQHYKDERELTQLFFSSLNS